MKYKRKYMKILKTQYIGFVEPENKQMAASSWKITYVLFCWKEPV